MSDFSLAKGKKGRDIFKLKLSLLFHVEVARTKIFEGLYNGECDIVLNRLPAISL